MKPETSIELLKKDVKEIKTDIQELKDYIERSFTDLKKNIDEVKTCYVRNERFSPIEKGTYAIISAIILSLLGAVLSVLLK